MNKYQALAIQALNNMMGDDTARARASFRHLTPEQMLEQHGCSGKSRAAILTSYEDHDAKIEAAIIWVKNAK